MGGIYYQRKGAGASKLGSKTDVHQQVAVPQQVTQSPACRAGAPTEGGSALETSRSPAKSADKVSFLSAAPVTLLCSRTWSWSCLTLSCFQLGLVLGRERAEPPGLEEPMGLAECVGGWVGGGGDAAGAGNQARLGTDPATHQAQLTSPSSKPPSLTFLPGRALLHF